MFSTHRSSNLRKHAAKTLLQVLLLVVMLAGVACSSLAATVTPTAQAASSSVDQAVDAMLAGKATATPQRKSATATPRVTPRGTPSGKPAKDPYIMKNVKVYDFGNLVFQGDIDLKPTLARIAKGIEDPHPNDGAVFTNRERRLPRQPDRNYYHEYVLRTKGIRGVGPQRVILGNSGEIFYTPDHYATFVRVK